MPRPRKRPLSPLAKELRERAQHGAKVRDPQKFRFTLELGPVIDLGGEHVEHRFAAFEVLLRRAIRDIGEGKVPAPHLRNPDFERRARAAEVLLQTAPRSISLDLSTRRRDVCRRIVPGNVGTFRQGYELDTYELVAEALRQIAREHAALTGRPTAERDEGRRLVSQQVLAHTAVPVVGLGATLMAVLGVLPHIRVIQEADLPIPSEEELAKAAQAETIADFQHHHTDVWILATGQRAFDMGNQLLAQSLFAFAKTLVVIPQVLSKLETWEGPGSDVADEAAVYLSRIVDRAPFPDPVHLSRLRVAARSGEIAEFAAFLEQADGLELHAAWARWIETCRCCTAEEDRLKRGDDPTEIELTDKQLKGQDSGCRPHAVRNAAFGVFNLIDFTALPAHILADVEATVEGPSPLDELLATAKRDLYFTVPRADDEDASVSESRDDRAQQRTAQDEPGPEQPEPAAEVQTPSQKDRPSSSARESGHQQKPQSPLSDEELDDYFRETLQATDER